MRTSNFLKFNIHLNKNTTQQSKNKTKRGFLYLPLYRYRYFTKPVVGRFTTVKRRINNSNVLHCLTYRTQRYCALDHFHPFKRRYQQDPTTSFMRNA